jgi:hypothetical protein
LDYQQEYTEAMDPNLRASSMYNNIVEFAVNIDTQSNHLSEVGMPEINFALRKCLSYI